MYKYYSIICICICIKYSIIDESSFSNLNEIEEQSRVGTRVRKAVLSIKKKPLPRKLQTSHLIAGECDIEDIPHELINLLLSIITDNDPRRLKSEKCMRCLLYTSRCV